VAFLRFSAFTACFNGELRRIGLVRRFNRVWRIIQNFLAVPKY
jgi:hypothetical protein